MFEYFIHSYVYYIHLSLYYMAAETQQFNEKLESIRVLLK